ncbi:MAG: hypothetical protein JO270_22855, partial [Acidobacteriaceae bacterium]|nr:hypothetical protein [Acidobacteriaceae bacterium]
MGKEAGVLQTHGAFGHPGVARHLRDEFAFDVVDGLLGFHEALKEIVIFFL